MLCRRYLDTVYYVSGLHINVFYLTSKVKLTLLAEEKRQLMKLLEIEREKRVKLEENFNNNNAGVNGHLGNGITDFQLHLAPPPVPAKRKTRDASVGRTIITRDIGITHTMPRTRYTTF